MRKIIIEAKIEKKGDDGIIYYENIELQIDKAFDNSNYIRISAYEITTLQIDESELKTAIDYITS